MPVLLDRTKVALKVDGRMRVFRGISADDSFSVEAQIGPVVVTVTCPDGHPGAGFSLGKLHGQALEEFVRPERDRWNKLERASRRRPPRLGA